MPPGQRSAGSGTHVHWLGGKADRVDADRGERPRNETCRAGRVLGWSTHHECLLFEWDIDSCRNCRKIAGMTSNVKAQIPVKLVNGAPR